MSVLAIIQTAAAERLLSDDFFANIPVLTERLKDLGDMIDTALGELGICVIVVTPLFNVTYGNVPGAYFDQVALVARVVENVTINGIANPDGPTALDVCERIAHLWQLFTPHGTSQAFVAKTPTIVLAPQKGKALVAYDVYFTTAAASTNMNTVAAPRITVADGIATLFCNTFGATIYYTLDGSYPRAGNPSAILYTEPFAVNSLVITAGAYKAGWFPGSLMQVIAPGLVNEDGSPALNEDGQGIQNED